MQRSAWLINYSFLILIHTFSPIFRSLSSHIWILSCLVLLYSFILGSPLSSHLFLLIVYLLISTHFLSLSTFLHFIPSCSFHCNVLFVLPISTFSLPVSSFPFSPLSLKFYIILSSYLYFSPNSFHTFHNFLTLYSNTSSSSHFFVLS